MPSNTRKCSLVLLFGLVSSCSVAEHVAPATPDETAPSEHAFHSAMEHAFAEELGPGTAAWRPCRAVRDLQCSPVDLERRSRCTYRYERGREGGAVLEAERHGFWRWISGPKNCTAADARGAG